MWWSWVLTIIGVTGLYLTTRKLAIGYAVGVGVQILWFVFGATTGQYGFILSAFVYGAVNFIGFHKWTQEARAKKKEQKEEAWKALELTYLYFTGVNPEYPPHYWELKTSFGTVIQRSISYPTEHEAIVNAVKHFGDQLFDPDRIIIDTSPDILAKVTREFARQRSLNKKYANYQTGGLPQ